MQQFGKNFEENLLQDFTDTSLKEAKKFIQHYLEIDTLNGKTFLDAGCGSGVFTLAAHELGARVTSFDIDPVAIQNTVSLLKKFNHRPEDVLLITGDILSEEFIRSLGQFDVVLCWGVTHHTGRMWDCLRLITQTVKSGGRIHLGIYNKADGFAFYPDGRFGPSSFWRKVKKLYVSLPGFAQSIIDNLAVVGIVLIYLLTFNNPVKKLKSNERRGMTWKSDLKDWLIGYPYEYATPEEVFDFMKNRGFSLEKLRTNNGLLTNNYVFQKT